MNEQIDQIPKKTITKEEVDYFLHRFSNLPPVEYFGESSQMSEAFYNMGEHELARRWSYLYFKLQLNNFLCQKDKLNWSHSLPKASWEMMAGKVNTDFSRQLGELCGRLYESAGRPKLAYEFYRANCPDKYTDKLNSVKLEDNGEELWELRIPSEDSKDRAVNFPDFHKAKTPEEHSLMKQKLLGEFLKSIPSEILNIDINKDILGTLWLFRTFFV